jgi:hypothetical protein
MSNRSVGVFCSCNYFSALGRTTMVFLHQMFGDIF